LADDAFRWTDAASPAPGALSAAHEQGAPHERQLVVFEQEHPEAVAERDLRMYVRLKSGAESNLFQPLVAEMLHDD